MTAGELIFFFTEIKRNHCGDLILGRRGHKTRIRWRFSLRSVGQVAQGKISNLANIDHQVMEKALTSGESKNVSPMTNDGLTISEAKRLLALKFGLQAEDIEIIIGG